MRAAPFARAALAAAALCCAHAGAAGQPAAPASQEAGRLPANLPFRREPETVGATPGVLAALGVLALAGGVAVALRRQALRRPPQAAPVPWLPWANRGAADGPIRLVGSRQLSPGVRLHVVEWEGRRYLLSNGQHGVTVLDRGEAP